VHQDLLIVSTEGNVIKIDQIRAIMEETSYRTGKGRFRVIIIEEAEKLGDEASNALLKILEEPPEGNVFILTTSRYYQILPTIRSRCCRIALQPMPQAELIKVLRKNRQDIPEPDATSCVLLADGSYSRLMEIITHEAPYPWKTLSSRVESIAHIPMWQFFFEVGKWLEEYDDLETLLRHLKVWLVIYIRNFVSHTGESSARYLDKCLDFFETIEEAEQALRFNVNKTLLLEEIGIRIKEDLYEKAHWS
jgi:DNA polymerase-3 subunit delta'